MIVDGSFDLSSEALTIAGTGVGGIGAVESLGNSTLGAVTLAKSSTITSATAGSTLTIGGAISIPAIGDITFGGAGNITVNQAFGNGNNITTFAGNLLGQWYSGGTASSGINGGNDSIRPTGSATDDLLRVQVPGASTLWYSASTPWIDFGGQTETAPGTGQILDRGGSNGGGIGGDPYAGSGVPIPPSGSVDSSAAVWTGFLQITTAGYYKFTTRSDDGSMMWLDLSGNGAFSTGGAVDSATVNVLTNGTISSQSVNENIVYNDQSQGMTNRNSAGDTSGGGGAGAAGYLNGGTQTNLNGGAIFLGVGSYAVRFATQNGGGGLGMQASYEMDADATGNTGGAGVFARKIIPSSAFSYLVGPNNNVIKNGSARLTLLGNNTYNGTTTVNAGTLEVDGTNASAANVTLKGTLAGNGSLPGAVSVATGGVISPGANLGAAIGTLTVGSVSFAAGLPSGALNIQLNGGTIAGVNYDQLNVVGVGNDPNLASVSLNSTVLNMSVNTVGVSADANGANYDFLTMAGNSTPVGSFAGINFGDLVTYGGKAFTINNNLVAGGDGQTNDIGLVKQNSIKLYVSAQFNSSTQSFHDSNPNSSTYTGGETISWYDPFTNPTGRAFASINDALNVYGTVFGATSIVVDSGSYAGITSITTAANIVLTGRHRHDQRSRRLRCRRSAPRCRSRPARP